jgi:hypothetical protein
MGVQLFQLFQLFLHQTKFIRQTGIKLADRWVSDMCRYVFDMCLFGAVPPVVVTQAQAVGQNAVGQNAPWGGMLQTAPGCYMIFKRI